MDDLLHCPICGNKLRNSHLDNKLLHPINKIADYVERVCAKGHSHVISFWTDKTTQQVDFLRVSLNSQYSRFIEFDYVNQRCRIICAQDGSYDYIEVPKLLELDFPDLILLKKAVQLLVVFN